jgi:hypothetical protein
LTVGARACTSALATAAKIRSQDPITNGASSPRHPLTRSACSDCRRLRWWRRRHYCTCHDSHPARSGVPQPLVDSRSISATTEGAADVQGSTRSPSPHYVHVYSVRSMSSFPCSLCVGCAAPSNPVDGVAHPATSASLEAYTVHTRLTNRQARYHTERTRNCHARSSLVLSGFRTIHKCARTYESRARQCSHAR